MWGLGALAFAYAFYQRVLPSVMVEELMGDFAVGGAVLGNLAALYFYVYAGMQIPIGAALDRWGTRRLLTFALALATAGSVLFALADGLTLAYLGRLMIGLGCAVGFVGTLTVVAAWFPHRRFAFMSGMTMLVGLVGGVLGQGPTAPIVDSLGWRETLLAAGLAGAALAAAIWLILRDRPPGIEPAHDHRAGGWATLLRGLAEVAGTRQIWIVSIFGCAMSGPMLSYGVLWGVPHLMVKYGVTRPVAAFSTSVVLVGWAVGAPLAGWLSDRLGRRKLPSVIAAALLVLLWPLLLYLPGLPLVGFWVGLFLGGAISAMMIVCFAMARENARLAVRSTATSFVNCMTVAAGALMQPLIGWLLDLHWDGTVQGGARIYGIEAYDAALLALPGSAIVALAFSLALRETNAEQPAG